MSTLNNVQIDRDEIYVDQMFGLVITGFPIVAVLHLIMMVMTVMIVTVFQMVIPGKVTAVV